MDAILYTSNTGSTQRYAALLSQATGLTPEDFTAERTRRIYGIALDLYKAGKAIDPVTIRAEAPDLAADYLLQLMEITPTAANAAVYARMVQETALRRKAAAVALSLSEPGADTAATVEQEYCG